MKSKTFVITSFGIIAIVLAFIAAINIAIDPLFQYHTPWFNLQPVITNERYQNAGIAKNFDFENVIIGNSLAENFRASQFEKVWGGKTVKLTAAGSHTIDWAYTLNILQNREYKPKNIILNMDTMVLKASATELKHELPTYLYDNNYLNDVEYLFNFSILKEFTLVTIKRNKSETVPDYDTAFMWSDDVDSGKDFVLEHYERPEITYNTDQNAMLERAMANIENLLPYISSMSETQFVFFYSPESLLLWDKYDRQNAIEAWRTIYTEVTKKLMEYENVKIFFWNDDEMLSIMGNLDNYTDAEHYSPKISELMVDRISENYGVLTEENYKYEIDKFFDYLSNYNYDLLIE